MFSVAEPAVGAADFAMQMSAIFGPRQLDAITMATPLDALRTALHTADARATVAGVLMGMTVPARQRHDEHHQMTHAFVAKVDPISKAVALPVFAFFAAGVTVVGGGGLGQMLGHPVSVGVVLGLVLGKPIGIWGGTIVTRDLFAKLRANRAVVSRGEAAGLGEEPPPCFADGVLDRIVVVEQAVREEALFQIEPKALDRIEFR